MNENTARMIFKLIVEAMNHVHSCGVLHRDMKSENNDQDDDTGEAKSIDFSCGILLCEEPYKDFSGTPECYVLVWFNKGYYYALSSATWSLGVLLREKLCGDVTFIRREVSKTDLKFKDPQSRKAKHLTRWMLSSDPKMRPSFKDVIRHL